MELATGEAGVRPGQIDVLGPHATGTPKEDTAEIAAINAFSRAPIPLSCCRDRGAPFLSSIK